MKLLHIINGLEMGGAEKLIAETLPIYKKQGMDVELLLTTNFNTPLSKELEKKIKTHRLTFNSYYDFRIIFKIIPFLKEYDIIHVHLFPPLYFVAIAKILSGAKAKLIFTEHCTSNRRMNKLYKPVERLIYNRYTKIVCISDEVRTILMNHINIKANKFVIINNGINLTSIKEATPMKKSDIGCFNDSDFIVLMVAGFREQKDQKTLIRSLLYLPSNVKLMFAGDGALRSESEYLTEKLNLSNRVKFLGVRPDIPTLLQTADVVVLSTHFEGLSLSSIEGMASGKPFVASDVPGLSDIVAGAGILFPEGDEKKLAEEILKLKNDIVHYRQTSKKCQVRASEYDINKMVKKHIELYNSL